VRIIADAMVVLSFLEREGERYRNEAAAATFLGGRGLMDLQPALRLLDRICYVKWMKLEASVRAGRGLAGRFQFDTKEEEEIFSKGVEAFTSGHAASLATTYDFGRHRRVLDLGGGTGSFLLAILERYPSLECTLFELPAVVQVARRELTGNRFAERITLVEGDMLHSAIPEGHDLCIIAHVLHTLSPDHILEVFANLRKNMTPGARLLLVDYFTDPAHTDPPFAALVAGEFLLMTSEGDVYSELEVRDWLARTGWKEVGITALNGPVSLLSAEAVAP
jgi:SAM-dependent methyltransferase